MLVGEGRHASGSHARSDASTWSTSGSHVRSAGSAAAVASGYAAVTIATVALASWAGANPFVAADPWLGASGLPAALVSAGLGALVAAATIAATRVLVRRAGWARALHADLRPVVRDSSDTALLVVAVASGIGEEILFRGLLVPAVGVVAAALVFGLVHQVRGRARWGWMVWATVMGLAFGLVFRVTGSLVGPMLAHVAINAVNLRLLRDVDPEPGRPRRLGGLLARPR
jgi:membrane protease YdiL (CAAX protease family)